MRILFIGDIIGSLEREASAAYIPKLKKKYRPQMTIASGENVASSWGVTDEIYKKLSQGGADVVTMGNHTWDNKGIFEFTSDTKKMVCPANFPEGVPGQGMVFVKVNQLELAVINLQARTSIVPLEDSFKKAAEPVAIACKRTPLIFMDFHGETTSEKQAMGWFLDDQVSAVVRTHTHVQTNSARILSKRITFLSDVGMTGPYDGILGVKREPIIEKFMAVLPKRLEIVEIRRIISSACILKIDDQTDQVEMIEPIQISEDRPFQK